MNDFGRSLAVFSAHAEVVPYTAPLLEGYQGILRARGGSSNAAAAAMFI